MGTKENNGIGVVFIILLLAFVVFSSLRECSVGTLVDIPTQDFSEWVLRKQGAVKVLKISPIPLEKYSSSSRRSKVDYSFRSFVIYKRGGRNQKDLYRIEGEIRCYPKLRTLNPFDQERQSDYCKIQEMNKKRIQSQ